MTPKESLKLVKEMFKGESEEVSETQLDEAFAVLENTINQKKHQHDSSSFNKKDFIEELNKEYILHKQRYVITVDFLKAMRKKYNEEK